MAQKVDCWKSLDGQLFDTEELADARDNRVFNEFMNDTDLTGFLANENAEDMVEHYCTDHDIARGVLRSLFQFWLGNGNITVHENGCVTVVIG